MALECAVRRQVLYAAGRSPADDTKLCASHRLLRPQSVQGPALFTHFRILSLCTAGRDRGSYRFETEAVREHIAFYLCLFREIAREGTAARETTVSLTALDESRMDILRTEVLEELGRIRRRTFCVRSSAREWSRLLQRDGLPDRGARLCRN